MLALLLRWSLGELGSCVGGLTGAEGANRFEASHFEAGGGFYCAVLGARAGRAAADTSQVHCPPPTGGMYIDDVLCFMGSLFRQGVALYARLQQAPGATFAERAAAASSCLRQLPGVGPTIEKQVLVSLDLIFPLECLLEVGRLRP